MDSSEYDTFSGFILDRLGRIPHEKESFTISSYQVVVKEKDGNRIKKYIVKKLKISSDAHETEAKDIIAP